MLNNLLTPFSQLIEARRMEFYGITTPKEEARTLASPPKGQTQIASGGYKGEFFSERRDRRKHLAQYRTIYQQGGPISEAVDCYPLFCLSNGYHLEGDDETLVQSTQDKLDEMFIEQAMWEGIIDAIVFGDAFQENLYGGGDGLVGVAPRPSETFDILYESDGTITGYVQKLNSYDRGLELKPEQITHLKLFEVGGDVYGTSIVGRAYDEILRDTKIAEAIAASIERHGFPKYHVKVGEKDKPMPTQAEIKDLQSEFEDLQHLNEFVTTYDVEIAQIDQSGIANIAEYGAWAIQRLCTALGVPEEILGLGRGSTEATANVRLQAFYDKIGTIQKRVARCYNANVVDRITKNPGAVKIVFNDVSPTDEDLKASVLLKLGQTGGIDPFAILDSEEMREYMGFEPRPPEEILAKQIEDQKAADQKAAMLAIQPPPFQQKDINVAPEQNAKPL